MLKLKVQLVKIEALFPEGFEFTSKDGNKAVVTKVYSELKGNILRPMYEVKVGSKTHSNIKESFIYTYASPKIANKTLLATMLVGTKYNKTEVKIQWSDKMAGPYAIIPGAFDASGKRWVNLINWYDTAGTNVTRWIQAGLVRLYAGITSMNLAKRGTPTQYIDSECTLATSCFNCQCVRMLKGSDTYEGDSDADIASKGTTRMGIEGIYDETFVCALNGSCPASGDIHAANMECTRGNEHEAARMYKEAPIGTALNCASYTFKGNKEVNAKQSMGWLVNPGNLRFDHQEAKEATDDKPAVIESYLVKTAGYHIILI